MDSALTPREIQTRIRGGASLDEVAEAAGVPAAQIEAFALPVLAEREHVVGQALSCPVRKRGESSSARSMRQVVREHLQHRGIDIDDVDFDSWREPDRRWVVQASTDSLTAHFVFDPRARFSMARDDQARELIGEPLPSAPKPVDPDSEPTVEIDDDRSSPAQSPVAADPLADVQADVEAPRTTAAEVAALVQRVTAADAAGAAALTEAHQSQLDVLYDMLSAFDEDSVNIYSDLSVPVIDDLPEAAAAEESTPIDDTPRALAQGEPQDAEEAPVRERAEDAPRPEPGPDGSSQGDEHVEIMDTTAEQSVDTSGERSITEPEQDALVEAPAPKPRPRARKGRASVPSWDEIMFGGPRPKK